MLSGKEANGEVIGMVVHMWPKNPPSCYFPCTIFIVFYLPLSYFSLGFDFVCVFIPHNCIAVVHSSSLSSHSSMDDIHEFAIHVCRTIDQILQYVSCCDTIIKYIALLPRCLSYVIICYHQVDAAIPD